MTAKDIVQEFRTKIEDLYGDKLKDIILYGSWARGEATEASDIDLLVVLEGPVVPGQEIDRMIDIVTDINLKYCAILTVYPVSEVNFATLKSPLLMNVRREGVAV